MYKKELLNEEKYKEVEEKIKKIAITILTIGISLGSILIMIGLNKQLKISDKYSNKNKETVLEKLEQQKELLETLLEKEKQEMISSKKELTNKITPIKDEIKRLDRVPFNGFNNSYYEREDKIDALKESIKKEEKDLDTIEDVLDEDFNDCSFSAAKNNTYTSYYCKVKSAITIKENEIANIDDVFSDFNKKREGHNNTPFYMIGSFLIITSLMISTSVYMTTKGRDLLAFTTTQMMPIINEEHEKKVKELSENMKKINKK